MSATRFSFDEFELDPERYELLRSGEVQAVEPRVLDLLIYLVRHPGRLLSKDLLVADVWSGETVSDAALSRAVHQARRALGDSAAEPRWIETVHGRGLRFLGAVEEVAADDSPRKLASPDPPAAPPDRRRRAWRMAVAALALIGAAVLLWRGTLSGRAADGSAELSSTATGATAPLPTIALHGFTAPADDAELRLVALSIMDLLGSRLEAVDGVAVRQTAAAGGGPSGESAAAVGERHGARYVLTGTLARDDLDDGVSVSVDLHEVVGRQRSLRTPLGHYALPPLATSAGLDRYIRVRDHIAQRVLALLLPALREQAAHAPVPRDAEAYRYYLLGYERLLDDYCAGGAAEALLERSVDIDPSFAPAWFYLGAARFSQIWACGGAAELYPRAIAAFDRAAEADPDYLDPRVARISILVETGEVERAFEELLAEESLRPDAPQILDGKHYALRYAGFLDHSLAALERLRTLDPLAFTTGANSGSPTTYLYLGRDDDFLAELPSLDMPYFAFYRGFVLLLRGDHAGTRRAVEPALSASPGGVFGQLCHALVALADGDRESARGVVESVSRHRRELGHRDGEITYKQAQLLALAGAPDRAVEELGRAVADGFFCPRCFETDPALTALAGRADFADVLSRARRRHAAFGERFGIGEPVR